MHPLLALALVVAAGIGVTRLPLSLPRRFAPLDAVLLAGAPFVVAGALLGPALQVLDATTLRALAPVAALGIGWIGASVGARTPWRLLRRISPREWRSGAALGAIAFVAAALAAWLLMRFVPALGQAWRASGGSTVPAALTFGAAAAISTGMAPARARRLALTGTVVAVGLTTLLLALYRPGRGWAPGAGVVTIAATLLIAALAASAFIWLARLRPNARDHRLELAGVVLLGSATGLAAGLSPFLICGIAAALIAGQHRAGALVASWEPWISAVLLVVAGAMLRVPTAWIVVAAVLLEGLRLAARWLPARYGRLWPPPGRAGPPAVLPQSASGAVAIALTFELLYTAPGGGGGGGAGGGGGGAVLATVVGGVLLARATAGVIAELTARAGPLTAAPSRAEVT